jgi:hypothetical protein
MTKEAKRQDQKKNKNPESKDPVFRQSLFQVPKHTLASMLIVGKRSNKTLRMSLFIVEGAIYEVTSKRIANSTIGAQVKSFHLCNKSLMPPVI